MRTFMTVGFCAALLMFTLPAVALFETPETLEGIITSISEDSLTIAYEQGTAQQIVEIQVNAETQFDETASLDTFHEGDLIKVQYKESDDGKVALSIAKVESEKMQEVL